MGSGSLSSKTVFLMAGLTFSVSTKAAEGAPCHCDAYREIAGIGSLSAQMAALGISMSDAPLEDQLQALRLRIQSHSLIPSECRARLLAELPSPSFHAVARQGVLAPGSNRTQDTVSAQLGQVYDAFYTGVFRFSGCQESGVGGGPPRLPSLPNLPNGPGVETPVVLPLPGINRSGASAGAGVLTSSVRPPSIALKQPAASCAEQAFDRFSQFWQEPNSKIAEQLQGFTLSDGTRMGDSEIRILRAYHQVLNAGSEQELLRWASSRNDGLSNDEFLKLVAILGDRLLKNYDHDRAEAGVSEAGSVSGDRLLSAARTNALLGSSEYAEAYGLPEIESSGRPKAGVCRDIAVFQAKILEARGFKNTFVTSWSHRSGLHSTLITQDPSRPRQLYQFNYGAMAGVTDRDGGLALFQGVEDATLNYRISDPQGRSLADIPSEMGKLLSEAAGFNIRSFDPLARTTSSLTSFSTPVGPAGNDSPFAVGAVTGTDSTGARYLGATGSAQWGKGGNTPGRVGVVVGTQFRPAGAYHPGRTENALVTYVQAEQHLRSDPVELRPGVSAVLDSSVVATGGVTRGFGNPKDVASPGGALRLNTEAKVFHASEDGRYQGTYRAGVQVDPVGVSDVREAQIHRVLRPHVNLGYAQASGSYFVAPGVALIGEVTSVVSQLGVRGQIEAGLASERFAATAGLSGRLTESSALIEERSIRRVGGRLLYRPLEGVSAGLTGEIPIEGDVAEGAQLFGTLAVVF